MLHSMTGYAKQNKDFPGGSVVVEIRTLNSKFLDLNLKYPSQFKEVENKIRNQIKSTLIRGKVDCVITIEYEEVVHAHELNSSLIKRYYSELTQILEELKVDSKPDPALLLELPDMLQKKDTPFNESEWQVTEQALLETCAQLMDYRKKEGDSLSADFNQCINRIEKHTNQVDSDDKGRIEKIRNRLNDHLTKFFDESKIDRNRFEQEAIYYIEKLDITEELSRLRSHLQFFREILESPQIEKGKKLNFIAQEIGREVNTMGAKLNDANLQRIVVEMKDELEKIKEQTLNSL